MRRGGTRRVLGWALLLACSGTAARVGAEEREWDDEDRRATLALLLAADPASPMTLEKVGPAEVKALDRKPDSPNAKPVYVKRWGLRDAVTGWGNLKVTLDVPPDSLEKFTRLAGRDRVEVWSRDVTVSDAEKFTEWVARQHVGRVGLYVTERRPLDERVETAAHEISERWYLLREGAARAGLLLRTRLSYVVDTAVGSRERELGREPLLLGYYQDSTDTYRVRIELLDSEGAPVKARAHRIRLQGVASQWVRPKNATYEEPHGWVVRDPALRFELVLELPVKDEAQRDDMIRQLFRKVSDGSESGLGVVVSSLLPDPSRTDEDFSKPDSITIGVIRFVAWEPCVSALVVGAEDDPAMARAAAAPATVHTWWVWESLREAAALRSGPIPEATPVLSGWKLEGSERDVRFLVHEASGKDGRPLTVRPFTTVRCLAQLDVLASLEEQSRRAVVGRHFQVTSWRMDVFGLGSDPNQWRAGVPAGEAPIHTQSGDGAIAFVDGRPVSLPPEDMTAPPTPGAAELRLQVTVRGRLSDMEEPVEKTVRLAVRGRCDLDEKVPVTWKKH